MTPPDPGCTRIPTRLTLCFFVRQVGNKQGIRHVCVGSHLQVMHTTTPQSALRCRDDGFIAKSLSETSANMYVCVCIHTHIRTHTCIHTHVCARRGRMRERERERERKKEREFEEKGRCTPSAPTSSHTTARRRRPVLLTALSNAQLPHAVCVYNRIEPIIEITPGDPLMVPDPLKSPKA